MLKRATRLRFCRERVAPRAIQESGTRRSSCHCINDEWSDLCLAGLLHDVGKIGIRDDVLCNHGPLTPEEMQHVLQHPELGHAILTGLHRISSLLPGVLHLREAFRQSRQPGAAVRRVGLADRSHSGGG